MQFHLGLIVFYFMNENRLLKYQLDLLLQTLEWETIKSAIFRKYPNYPNQFGTEDQIELK